MADILAWLDHDPWHWLWLFLGLNLLGAFFITPGPDTESSTIPRVWDWVSDISRLWFVAFAVLGAIAGLIYSRETGQPIKPSIFLGAVGGLFFIPLVLLFLDRLIFTAAVGLFILIIYWVFFV
jgi:hypothetical protein